jgi:SAM-dependent methyltransferase
VVAKAALRTLSMFPEVRTVVDLGCLEGGYAKGFADAGYETLGIEVRDINYERCQLVKNQGDNPNLNFVQDDAWNMGQYGPFDATICFGLLYHFHDPVKFIKMAAEQTNKVLIIQTHYAVHLDEKHEGYLGKWYNESPWHEWGAWEINRSFWLSAPGILAVMRDAGFNVVFRQYDYLPDIIDPYPICGPAFPAGDTERGMFVGVKV